MTLKIKAGFVPSIRFRRGESLWCKKMRNDSLATFSKVAGLEIVVPEAAPEGVEAPSAEGYTVDGMVCGLDEAETIAEYFIDERVDALILCPLDFGDERSASKIAEKLDVPVLLYATKEPPVPEGPAMARVSDSYCGNLSMASGLYRRKIPFHYAGIFFPEEEALLKEVKTFVAAASVVRGLKGARIGQVGVRPDTFETVGYDEAALIQKFDQNVIYSNLFDVVEVAKGYDDDDPEVLETVEAIKAGVNEVTVAQDYLIKAAKMELALAKFWKDNGLSAMAVQCWPSIRGLMGISLCAVYGRLTGQDMLTACEVDVLGALSMLVNYRAALGDKTPHFIDWTIQHREDPNKLLAWHCGNAPTCLAKNPEETALRSRHDMAGELPVEEGNPMAGLYQFQIKPGTVTFCRLAEYDNEWKMLIATGEIEPSDETLAGTWSWVKVSDHAKLYRTLVEEGFVHHASMMHGDQTDVLLQACKYLDIEPVVVK